MLNVVIVENNKRARETLKEYIEGKDISVSAIYNSGEDALELIPTFPIPDVILMDIGLTGISGIETTRKLKDLYPELEIIILTIFEDSKTIIEAIKAGASGYILKVYPQEDILKAIHEVKKGSSFLSGNVARKILKEFQHPKDDSVKANVNKDFSLTQREDEILREIINGKTYKEIAEKLFISFHTVNNHIRKIYEKMRVHSKGEAVAKSISTSTSAPFPGSE